MDHGFGYAEIMIRSFSIEFNGRDVPSSYQARLQIYSTSEISTLGRMVDSSRSAEAIMGRDYDYVPFGLIWIFDQPAAAEPTRKYTFDQCYFVDETTKQVFKVSRELLAWTASTSFQDRKAIQGRGPPCKYD